MSATILDGKTQIKFCVVCHKIHIVGKWQKITKKVEGELRKNFGKWDADLVTCESCKEE